MKAINTIAGLALAAYAVFALAACSQTSNGSSPATTPTTCTMSASGMLVDQYGNPCSSASGYGCNGYTYTNGQYYGSNGQVANCNSSQYVIPGSGYYGNNYVSGCQQWTMTYGVQYVPVNMGGQLVCVNYNYLVAQIPTYQSTAYVDPNYWYSNPPQVYPGYYGYGGGMGCNSISLGFSTGDFAAGGSICL